jgi:hypothetical protein
MQGGKQDVKRFIRATFRSVWSLELLCFLRKQPDRDWTTAELVSALRASDLVMEQSLAALSAAGLVVTDAAGAARYQPATPALDLLAAETVAIYAHSPDAVRRMIVLSVNNDLTAFADAFRFRKDP